MTGQNILYSFFLHSSSSKDSFDSSCSISGPTLMQHHDLPGHMMKFTVNATSFAQISNQKNESCSHESECPLTNTNQNSRRFVFFVLLNSCVSIRVGQGLYGKGARRLLFQFFFFLKPCLASLTKNSSRLVLFSFPV